MKITIWTLLFLLLSCQKNTEQVSSYPMKEKILKNQTIGVDLMGNAFTNIYFAGQPSKEDLEALKKQGFSTVINLRHPEEDGKENYSSQKEALWAQSNELSYYQIPLKKGEQITEQQINQVTSKVKEHRKEGKILIHCGTGNRAAVWTGAHFFLDHKFSKKDAWAIAKDLGLSSEKAIKSLSGFFKQRNP